MYRILESTLHLLVQYSILAFEYIGIFILIITGIRGVIDYFTRKPHVRLHLAKGMATGLEFKLGSEILRTVVVRSVNEMYIVAGIILLRAALTFLIHWEIKNAEEAEDKREQKKCEKEGCWIISHLPQNSNTPE